MSKLDNQSELEAKVRSKVSGSFEVDWSEFFNDDPQSLQILSWFMGETLNAFADAAESQLMKEAGVTRLEKLKWIKRTDGKEDFYFSWNGNCFQVAVDPRSVNVKLHRSLSREVFRALLMPSYLKRVLDQFKKMLADCEAKMSENSGLSIRYFFDESCIQGMVDDKVQRILDMMGGAALELSCFPIYDETKEKFGRTQLKEIRFSLGDQFQIQIDAQVLEITYERKWFEMASNNSDEYQRVQQELFQFFRS